MTRLLSATSGTRRRRRDVPCQDVHALSILLFSDLTRGAFRIELDDRHHAIGLSASPLVGLALELIPFLLGGAAGDLLLVGPPPVSLIGRLSDRRADGLHVIKP